MEPKNLKIGKNYSNNKISNEIFECNIQKGMKISKKYNALILLANHIKSKYSQKWNKDILNYTGTGRKGNQELKGENERLANSRTENTTIYLFESFKKDEYTYRGEVELVSEPYQEEQKDDNNNDRLVWKFPISIKDKDKQVRWVIPANHKVYNHEASFEKNGFIDWKQNNNFNVGDIVYLYSTKPYKKIRFKTIVEKESLPFSEYTEDKEFWINPEDYPNENDKFARLRLIEKVDTDELSLDNLLNNGLSVAPQRGIRSNEELTHYIEKHFKSEFYPDYELINTTSDKKINEDNPYSSEDFLNEVYITKKEYNDLKFLLKNKKNIIIEGAPGVGKTFIAKRLAYSIIESKDESKVKMVQFHQSYSYEDFIMGYKPSEESFELKSGPFYEFCKKAEDDVDNYYFFIIDEINRGNINKIFGELFMLIENDKRGKEHQINLLYSNELFSIPENLYIIGLMNTADRSLAMIDYALRRRFSFFPLKPGFSSEGFKEYQKKLSNTSFDNIIRKIKELNKDIENDETLGEGFMIGHSYFCNIDDSEIDKKLEYIIKYEIIPLLKEYWFDEINKIENWTEKLNDEFNN